VRQRVAFDPYALLEALERNRVSYVVVGAFARVVHGTGEVTRGLDIVPSSREENLRRLVQALDELGRGDDSALAVGADPVAVHTPAGRVTIVPEPWGTRGYDDIRIRGNRENLGRGLRPQIASTVDLVRMLDASDRPEDADRLQRLRRLMELERVRTRRRGLRLER
jgi:hypothetical protein